MIWVKERKEQVSIKTFYNRLC